MYLGDYTEDYATLNHKFTSRAFATGIPTVLSGSPVIAVYKGSATGTEKTSAESYITLAIDFDSKVGLNNILIDLSGDAFFAVGEDYAIVITTGTVGGVSVVGETICTFSIENRFDEVDVTKLAGSAQSATDLQSFADDGFDPATDKITGVLLADVCTTNTDMVGTDSAALATTLEDSLGLVAEAAAAGDPSETESVMQYVKQIVNILAGTAGVTTYPAEAAPGNGASLAEVIRAIHVDVTGLNGDAMVGTDNAATAANVNTEVSDVLKTDTISEMAQGLPPVTPTFEEVLMYLYMVLRNDSTSTATVRSIKNNAGTVIAKATMSDNSTTFSQGKLATGA